MYKLSNVFLIVQASLWVTYIKVLSRETDQAKSGLI